MDFYTVLNDKFIELLKIEKELKKAEENKKKIERKKIKDQERIEYLNYLQPIKKIIY